MARSTAEQHVMGDPLMLEKIDKLFACGVGEHVNLPQIVVVGDQSSGKSSILEGLVRMPLPRDSGLCTRFATQIIFRRAAEERILISIIADASASAEHKAKVKGYSRTDVESLDSATFVKIMKEVHQVMGVSQVGDVSGQMGTFSNDVLRLEITGPNQQHFSVIDVPGIFRNTEKGLTTKKDIELVKDMVLGYMENPRSVMLAVVPANTDVATQDILELAHDMDPEGDRTLGVLTKPDLIDKGAESKLLDLLEGRAKVMKLGWHVVRNPGQNNLSDATLKRDSLELEFFKSEAPWKSISKDKVGIESLRDRLKDVLSGLVKQEFPKVKLEVNKKLAHAQKVFDGLGPDRNTTAKQATYLVGIASQYERLVLLSLQAKFASDKRFDTHESLRIASAVVFRSTTFADEMAKFGHSHAFATGATPSTKSGNVFSGTPNSSASPGQAVLKKFVVRKEDDIEDIIDILHEQKDLPIPNKGDIISWLRDTYEHSRGFELGTFDSGVLGATLKKQASKWTSISLGYVSDIIVIIHRFITTAIGVTYYNARMKEALLGMLFDGLMNGYNKAIQQVRFLLSVELDSIPMTQNHYFNDNLQKARQARQMSNLESVTFDAGFQGKSVTLESATRVTNMSNTDHVVQDIHDILSSYYKVARKRFVDNVIKQAADYFLVNGPDTPLKLFSPIFVSKLNPEELEHIAGEALRMKRERARVAKEIASLTEAKAILLRG